MDEDHFNLTMRKFLKEVGVTSQRELEKLVRSHGVEGDGLDAQIVLTIKGTSLRDVVTGYIEIERHMSDDSAGSSGWCEGDENRPAVSPT